MASKPTSNKDKKQPHSKLHKKPYPFKTGLEPVGDWTQASPFICGSCGNKQWPQKTYKGECTKCGYKILYKQRPRYQVWHKAR